MASKYCGEEGRSIGEIAFVIAGHAIQAAEAPEALLLPANAGAFRYQISATWTDIAFPEFQQILFF